VREPLQPLGQSSIQQIGNNRQGEIEVHVQPHITAQAVQMAELSHGFLNA
jgi:hypothetical protein